MNATTIPYGPDHRREWEALIGVDFDPARKLYGTQWTDLLIAQETLCGITYECYRVTDGRILVRQSDRYSCYSVFTFYPDHKTWSQWFYVDHRRGEIDPETGRYKS